MMCVREKEGMGERDVRGRGEGAMGGGRERRNVFQECIRDRPRAGEAASVENGGIPEERVGKKHIPASGRGEGTSADECREGNKRGREREKERKRSRSEPKKRVRPSPLNFIRNSVRPFLSPSFSLLTLLLSPPSSLDPRHLQPFILSLSPPPRLFSYLLLHPIVYFPLSFTLRHNSATRYRE